MPQHAKSIIKSKVPAFQMQPSVSRSILSALVLSDEDKVSDGSARAISVLESIPGSGLQGVVQLDRGWVADEPGISRQG